MTLLRSPWGLAIAIALTMPAAGASIAAERSFRLDIASGAVPREQRAMRVHKGDDVTLVLTADAAGEVHVHGYRLSVKLRPGQESRMQFKAFATGRYAFEWHGGDAGHGNRGHHAPPLSVLEVHPR